MSHPAPELDPNGTYTYTDMQRAREAGMAAFRDEFYPDKPSMIFGWEPDVMAEFRKQNPGFRE